MNNLYVIIPILVIMFVVLLYNYEKFSNDSDPNVQKIIDFIVSQKEEDFPKYIFFLNDIQNKYKKLEDMKSYYFLFELSRNGQLNSTSISKYLS